MEVSVLHQCHNYHKIKPKMGKCTKCKCSYYCDEKCQENNFIYS